MHSKDERLDEHEEDENEVLDDSVETRCFSLMDFLRFFSCNYKLNFAVIISSTILLKKSPLRID